MTAWRRDTAHFRKDTFCGAAAHRREQKHVVRVTEKGDYIAMLCEFSDLQGDMSNDGILNAVDASAILKDIVGLESGANPLMADFNGDGNVNAVDASSILKKIVGLI